MRKALSLSIIVSVLALVAYFTKPTEEACFKKATEEFREKIFYTVESAPKEIEKSVFMRTLEKSFLQKIQVADKFLYREIYQRGVNGREKIGWAALGWVNVNVK
jgi:hypothetical protein